MWLRHALRTLLTIIILSACSSPDRQVVDKLNSLSYAYHYRNLDSVVHYAEQAYELSAKYSDGRAEAMNNLAFAKTIRMQYEEALQLLDTIPDLTDNQVELLVSYVQQMRLCQRMSRNRAFYDYRGQAVAALQRLDEERQQLSPRLRHRLAYAESELAIVTSTYYYYVGLERQSIEAMDAIKHHDIERDTAQWLNYLYNVGAGGIITHGTAEEIAQQEFDHLMRCFLIARQQGYPFFAANAMESMAEHLIDPAIRQLLIGNNLPAMKYVNPEGTGDDNLPIWLADNALDTFREYGDVYQISGAYRTLASCYHAEGDDESALYNLELALEDERINQAPDLVASIREQLSVAYASIDDKQMSDFNRNIYLDLQEQTRQDRSLEARAGQLEQRLGQLNRLLWAVAISVVLLVALLFTFIYHYLQQKPQKQEESEEKAELLEQLALHRLHVEQNQRRALEQRAKVALVTSITPFIDRILHEVNVEDRGEKKEERGERSEERLQYIRELTDKIEELNDVLTHWIQLQKGEVSVHIESFALQPLFDIVARGRTSFQMKGVELQVIPTPLWVKADRVLTLFMLNTLADNARKFTPEGGTVSIEAQDADGYVELSVTDTGQGMTDEELARLMSVETLGVHAAHGFGLLNCRGIIEKYRKMSQIFSVCRLAAESRVGQGSRFYFRLPKGIVRLLLAALLSPLSSLLFPLSSYAQTVDPITQAKAYADSAYFCNIKGNYRQTLLYADSCCLYLNMYYRSACPEIPGVELTVLPPAIGGTTGGGPAEITWLHDSLVLNYDIILDIRNEIAVAALALHQWDVYRYNNRIYTQLFKELSADSTLDEYCRKMQRSQVNKTTAIVLLAVLLMAILVAVATQVMRSLNRRALRRQQQLTQIELVRDELRRVEMEEAALHVSNAVLDNCLSSLKHETMYFPSRIRQLVERGETEALPEVAAYYRELYGTLSEQALRQTENRRLHLEPLDHEILGDRVLVDQLFDVLRRQSGQKQLQVEYRPYDARFVEVRVALPALQLTQTQAATLFEPAADHLPFMLCRQIVRELGEAAGRTDAGIKAEVVLKGQGSRGEEQEARSKEQGERNEERGETIIMMKLPRQKYAKI